VPHFSLPLREVGIFPQKNPYRVADALKLEGKLSEASCLGTLG